jgi:hypothetical protein
MRIVRKMQKTLHVREAGSTKNINGMRGTVSARNRAGIWFNGGRRRMKNETDVIKIRIDSDVKTELEKIAESEQRTLAGQIRLALSAWLKTKSARPGRGAAAKH